MIHNSLYENNFLMFWGM